MHLTDATYVHCSWTPQTEERSPRSNGGWQTFTVSACHKKAKPHFSAWIYWKLLHALVPVADCFCHRSQTYKIVPSSFESFQAASCLPDRGKKKSVLRKNAMTIVNLLKQLFFSSLKSFFQGDQINSKQLPLLHHVCHLLISAQCWCSSEWQSIYNYGSPVPSAEFCSHTDPFHYGIKSVSENNKSLVSWIYIF